ncbi:hypothetical protein QR98_0062270 [Sarcoptes scabiei]|uniref:NGFI-A-binding-like protein n=1 Tax=Sarcoptes scabiei TaxID=52283 RepID=A0A132A9U3_SARSC|nr:hypothetical protein QR98_0062270 [Sarcoptes scabiei]
MAERKNIATNSDDSDEYALFNVLGSDSDSSEEFDLDSSLNLWKIPNISVERNSPNSVVNDSMPTNSFVTESIAPKELDVEKNLSKSYVRTSNQLLRMNFNDIFHSHNRILGRNLNGTIAMTTQPSNESELQLYRVLQRANLLTYYDTFICQGGDDVQQLYEAGEEEFLEIMALVGMAAKPLHVRRLQKALHEWATNPSLFQSPLVQPTTSANQSDSPSSLPISSVSRSLPTVSSVSNTKCFNTITSLPASISSSASPSSKNGNNSSSPSLSNSVFDANSVGCNQSISSSPNQFSQNQSNENIQPTSPSVTPILNESQIIRLAEAAESLVRSLPASFFDLKPPSSNNNNGNKKRIVKEIETVMAMKESDSKRMDEIRKYAAIYGRFDCKRKPEKPLTLHEVSVNEAAAQICSKIPMLLYRRDELFPLARQVVRDSGYQYSKGHSRSQYIRFGDEQSLYHHLNNSSNQTSSHHESQTKRMRRNQTLGVSSKLSLSAPTYSNSTKAVSNSQNDRQRRYDRLEGIVDQLKSLGNKQEEIESQLKEANEKKNFKIITELQNELNLITDHQMLLVNEKSQLEQQQQQQQQNVDCPK